MKRSLSLFIAILMVLSSVAVMSFTASAEETTSVGLAGVQEGENAIRLIGYIDGVEGVDAVGFSVTVAGSLNKSKQLDTTKVFTTVTSNGTPVAATKSSGVEAPCTVDHEYLYGYAIKGLANDAVYLFTVVPTVTLGEETYEGTAATVYVAVKDGDVTVQYIERAPVNTGKVTSNREDLLDAGEGILKIFDDNLGTKMCVKDAVNPDTGATLEIAWEFESAETLVVYQIVTGADASERDPKSWTLYGSEDGEEWVELDAVTDYDLPEERKATCTFVFANDTAYKHYKWVITDRKAAGYWGDYTQLQEFKLYAVSEEDDSSAVQKQALNPEYVCIGGQEHGAGAAGVFDGNLGTKMCREFGELPITITWEFDATEVLVKYSIVSGADHSDHPARDPKAWVLYGSNDKSTWTELDSVTGNVFYTNSTAYDYAVENTTAYQYYKLEITENGGVDGIGRYIVQFQELILYVAE